MSETTETTGRATGPDFASVAVGDQLEPREFTLRRADLVRYAGASGDFNPIHWNRRTAVAVGLPDVIVHGMLSMATAGRLVTDWCGDPGAVLEYSTRFTGVVPVPDDDQGIVLEVTGVVSAKDDDNRTVRVDLTAGCGEIKALGRARAVVRLR